MFIGNFNENENYLKIGVYKIDMWNIHARVCVNIPRTNNSVEGWHINFNSKNEISHTNIARLTTKMKDIEEISRFDIIHALSGNFRFA
jgi:hypothetical protein